MATSLLCSYFWTICNMVSMCLHKLLITFCLQCLYWDEDDAHLCILGTKDILLNCVKFLFSRSIRFFALFNFLIHCLVLPFFSGKLWFRWLWCSGGGGDGEEERGKEEKKGLLWRERKRVVRLLRWEKICIWCGFFVTIGFCYCHVSISFKMGENGRLQD